MVRKDIVMFILGTVIGAAITAIYYNNREAELLEQEAEFCKNLANKYVSYDVEPPEGFIKADGRVMNKEEDKVVFMNQQKRVYTHLARPYSTVKEYAESRCEDGRTEPYVISFEQFCEENDKYDKITLTYFAEDDTLSDEDEEIFQDTKAILGDDWTSSFGEGSEDPDVVYVRNNKLQIDYEIVRNHGSYSEIVSGIVKET